MHGRSTVTERKEKSRKGKEEMSQVQTGTERGTEGHIDGIDIASNISLDNSA